MFLRVFRWVIRKTYVLSSLFEHRVVTFSSLCDSNIRSLHSIRVCTYIDFRSKTCPKLVENRPKMNENWDLGGVGSVFLIIGVLWAGPMDAGGRFLWIWGSFWTPFLE